MASNLLVDFHIAILQPLSRKILKIPTTARNQTMLRVCLLMKFEGDGALAGDYVDVV